MTSLDVRRDLYAGKMRASIQHLVDDEGYCHNISDCYSCIFDNKCDSIPLSKRKEAAILLGIEKGFITDADAFDLSI